MIETRCEVRRNDIEMHDGWIDRIAFVGFLFGGTFVAFPVRWLSACFWLRFCYFYDSRVLDNAGAVS